MEHARTVSGRATRLERKRRYVEGSEGVRCVLNRRKKECVLNRRMKERTRKRRGERAFHADGQFHANGSVSREWKRITGMEGFCDTIHAMRVGRNDQATCCLQKESRFGAGWRRE